MHFSTLMLRSCRPCAPFTSRQRCSAASRTLHLAWCARAAGPDPSQQPAQPKGVPTALAALLPASLSVLQPGAAWSQSLQSELPRATALYELADIDAKTAGTIAHVLQPALAVAQLLMIVRIVLSWYPQVRHWPASFKRSMLPAFLHELVARCHKSR